MADDKISVDPVAHQASSKFLSIIGGGFQDAIKQLSDAGTTLSDPNHWSGPYAAQFRSSWSSAQTDLNKIRHSLDEFQRKFDTVLRNISAAGGQHQR
ncbi:hypothetical protein SBI_02219 [Streptomyces bingchenggensis BCW-1]|uniref:WXG100 family type VII secretion target n=1 Tax=Streptomyces bingchenggensis (strain BCW-1) TaxID=749414 RepID=D7BTC5_STRBB|nr:MULTISPECIES: hypothetical protein [Streptomyces]ADI05340.1 hypothetical protein SBI_02219 [Streptomyces bingchenggensis BCW-1]